MQVTMIRFSFISREKEKDMKVIWKRPDGFLESEPNDFTVFEMPSKSKLWLHKTDRENFPFRISGGWQDEESTRKLNHLVNLLTEPSERWTFWLERDFDDSKVEGTVSYIDSVRTWLSSVKENLKGDTWELEIMSEALGEIEKLVLEGAKGLKH